jgi:TIR domain
MSGKIFISYRRNDSEGEAGRLYDDLVRVFGAEAVFMDVSDIHPGKDFRQAIDENVAKCSVLLAIMGREWVTIIDPSGVRRLDQPNDFVRLEISSALARGIDVIPVLVHGASMVAPSDLPDNIQNLAFRNCVEITHARWNSDVERLIRTLRHYLGDGQQVPTRSIQMAITGASPILKPAVPVSYVQPATPRPALRVLRLLGAVIAVVVIAVLAAASYISIHHHSRNKEKLAHESQSTASIASPPANGAPPAAPELKSVSTVDGTAAGASSPPGNTPQSSHQTDKVGLSGVWINPEAKKGKPMRMEITAQGGETASIHLWTRHHDAPYDLGIKSVTMSDAGITVQWNGPFSDAGDKNIADQTVSMRIYRVGDGLHIVYSDADAGNDEFDFERSQ